MKRFMTMAATALALLAGTAQAVVVTVEALTNSSSGPGPTGKDTGIVLSLGQAFSVTASSDDLWSAGDLPRWSNADGLVVDLFATGSDESGEAAGTQIGASIANWSQNGLSAPFGALVGELGGTFFLIGTNFAGTAPADGVLKLYYWDSNYADNIGTVAANIEVRGTVSEPASLALLSLGLLGAAASRRRHDRAER